MFANLTVDENLRVPIERPGPHTINRVYAMLPRLLMLDEPSQGLAPLIVREVFSIVAQMRTEGISALLVEQNVRMSLDISDHAYVLESGQALAGASAEEWKLEDLLPV